MGADLSNRIGLADERFVPGVSEGRTMEAEHLVRYWWATGLAAGRRVLDAGCGAGYGTGMLAAAGAVEAVGVDVAQAVLDAAAEGAPAGARFLRADVHELPFEDGRFDLVVCFEVIEHLEGQDAVLAELARVLAPEGVLAISSPNRGVYPAGNPHHVHEYRPDELRAALERHFPHVALRRQHDWLAAAVLDDEQAAATALEARDDLVTTKIVGQGPGTERYTIALAGRTPLPEPAGRVLLTGADEIDAWLQELYELRGNELAAAQRDAALADVATLQGIEAGLRRDVAALLGELEEMRGTLRAVHGSLSWRVTRPLRATKRLRS